MVIPSATAGLPWVSAGTGADPLYQLLGATGGGTGQGAYAVGDILYASTTTALSRLADVATGNAMISGGVGVAPSWGKIGISTHVSGLGTGVATALAINLGTAGSVIVNGGAASLTSVSSPIYTSSGKLTFQSNGSTFAGSISTGQQWMFNPNDVSPAAGPVATISKNVAQLKDPAQGGASKTNVAAHFGTLDGSQGFLFVDNFGNSSGPSLALRSGRGTAASPTATQNGDFLFNFYAMGWGATVQSGFGAYMGAFATETWTDTAQGSAWVYYTNSIGSTSITERLRIAAGVMVGTTTDPGATNFSAGGWVQTGTSTVAALPTCNAAAKGARRFVSDATAPTYNATVAGAGAINIGVTCDGTNWKT
jgi:hypothetical protein